MRMCSSIDKSVGSKRNKKSESICLYYILFRMGCMVKKWNDPLQAAVQQVTALGSFQQHITPTASTQKSIF